MLREPCDSAKGCRVLYISPLKALAVDVERNLRSPLAGHRQHGAAGGRAGAHPGDQRAHGRHVAEGARAVCEASWRDSDHHAGVALPAADQRRGRGACGRWRRSSSTRSMRWCRPSAARTWRSRWSGWRRCAGGRLQRIGLSATQRPLEEVARFLGGAEGQDSRIASQRSSKR